MADDKVNIIISLRDKMAAGLRKASAKLNQFAVRTREAGQAMAIGSAVMGAAIFKVTSLAVDLDDQMRKTQARIAGVTSGEMMALRDMVKELGRTTSFTTSQVAELVAELARGGKSASEIQTLTKPMLDLARATGITTEQAAAFTQQALASFKMGVGEAAHVADVLTFAANNSFQGVEDLGEALKFAGPIAEQTGQSFEQVIASMSMMANVGIKGTMSGRQLRKVLVDLASNGSSVASELGVAIEDVDGKVRALPLILADFIEATKDMSQMQRIQKFNDAFGKIGLNASLIGGESADKIMMLADQLKNLEGTAKSTSDTMDGGIGGTLRRLYSAVEGLVLAFGESMIPVIDKMSAGFTILSNFLTPLLEKITWLGPTILAVFAAMAVGAAGLLTLAGVATVAAAAISAIGGVITAVSAIVGFFASGVGVVAAAFASGIGVIVALVAAVVVALVDWQVVWTGLVNIFNETWTLMSETVSSSLDGMVAAFSKGDLELAFQIAMKGLEVVFFGTMDILFGGWRDTVNSIVKFLAEGLRMVNYIWGNAIGAMAKAIVWVQNMLGLISDEVAAQMADMIDDDTTKNIESTLKQINELESSMTSLFGKSGEQRQAELDALIAKAKQVQTEVVTIQDLFNDLWDSMENFGESMMAQLERLEKDMSNMFMSSVKALKGFNVTQTVTSGAVGDFSTAGLASKLAKSQNDVAKEQLTEQKTGNTILKDVLETLQDGFFWGN